MTIDNLKCFILVAENLSFARAAEALYISQPAVTKQINALENELGVTLFIRSTRHVELTPCGISFYKDAKDIVMKSQMAINRVQRQAVLSDFIRIGTSSKAILPYLSTILQQVRSLYPSIRPVLEVQNYKTTLGLFLENKLDLLFYYKENMPKKKGIQFLELKKDSMACLMPSDHPLVKKETISFQDISSESLIACNPLNAPLSIAAFQQELLQNHPADKLFYCDLIEASHCMVSAGFGITILPRLLCAGTPNLTAVPFEHSMPLSFGVFYHKKNTSMILENFLATLSPKANENICI